MHCFRPRDHGASNAIRSETTSGEATLRYDLKTQTVPARSTTRNPFEELPVISSQMSETDWGFSNYSTRLRSDRGTLEGSQTESKTSILRSTAVFLDYGIAPELSNPSEGSSQRSPDQSLCRSPFFSLSISFTKRIQSSFA